jgi:3D-(3,5/4)-trihydroxycyclohexane-1,2-dione acylhydrolase (decyclizing)
MPTKAGKGTVRLTMAQAIARYLINQTTDIDGVTLPMFAGVWAIFGHGNVVGLGEALYSVREQLPTYRSHNEQAMAHAAVAYAKAMGRRRMMAVTTSIGPGATNMITAAAMAHVNRLPVLLLPGDVFANRRPDPVLQQVEDFGDGTVSANDCFRPVSRYFDRITRPEQIITALPRAMAVLTDPAECGPVTLALCQDVQSEAYDYPESFFAPRQHVWRRARPDLNELAAAVTALSQAKAPVIIAGGGVHYSGAHAALAAFSDAAGVPVLETQAGKSSLPDTHALNLGALGVTGTTAANAAAQKADVILAVGTRLADFTTGSWSLFANPARRIIQLNTATYDAAKRGALPLVADAREGLVALAQALEGWRAPAAWSKKAQSDKVEWQVQAATFTAAPEGNAKPGDSHVIGAVQRALGANAVIVGAAGGLPGELHKLWQAGRPGSYHMEYGYSTMGYEIAAGIGVKMAKPNDEVVVMIGDGSYMMMNSEIATSVMLGKKLIIVLVDNRGFACINRLQRGTGNESFNNLLDDAVHVEMPRIDFAAHAASMGADAVHVSSIADLEKALTKAKAAKRTQVVVIDTDPLIATHAGGSWWDVAVPEVSDRAGVKAARKAYEEGRKAQRLTD